MQDKNLKYIQKFCKQNTTVGFEISSLHKKFIAHPSYPMITLEQFEQGLVFLRKRVIKDLVISVLNYIGECGLNDRSLNDRTYNNFVEHHELITKKLWNEIITQKSNKEDNCSKAVSKSRESLSSKNPVLLVHQPPTQERKLSKAALKEREYQESIKGLFPPNWVDLSQEDRESYILNITDLDLLTSIIKKVKNADVVNAACYRWDSLIQNKIVKKTTYIKEDTESKKDFKNQLPLNWNTMVMGERVDFVRKIQHKEFRAYVLNMDGELKKYIIDVEKRNSQKSSAMSLYVNLFSFPSKSTSEEAKTLLKSFVESLNMLGRARLQYIEITDPPIVEIREVRR